MEGKPVQGTLPFPDAEHRLLAGRSAAVERLREDIRRAAASDAAVVILGESGTGKELAARLLHSLSRRRMKPFVPVNCAAVPETLADSELFGHARGAFTGADRARTGLFEAAQGGSIFLDEIAEAAASFQVRLLRVLQEREVRRVGENAAVAVDARVIAATNRSLSEAVARGTFRQDLFYRLCVIPLRVPPLRERRDDIPLLTELFLGRARQRTGRALRLSPEARRHLQNWDWPGNVRELENAVERAAAMAPGDILGPPDFPLDMAFSTAAAPVSLPAHPAAYRPQRLADALAAAEERAIREALARQPGDTAAAAAQLGISATTLWRKMKKMGLSGG